MSSCGAVQLEPMHTAWKRCLRSSGNLASTLATWPSWRSRTLSCFRGDKTSIALMLWYAFLACRSHEGLEAPLSAIAVDDFCRGCVVPAGSFLRSKATGQIKYAIVRGSPQARLDVESTFSQTAYCRASSCTPLPGVPRHR